MRGNYRLRPRESNPPPWVPTGGRGRPRARPTGQPARGHAACAGRPPASLGDTWDTTVTLADRLDIDVAPGVGRRPAAGGRTGGPTDPDLDFQSAGTSLSRWAGQSRPDLGRPTGQAAMGRPRHAGRGPPGRNGHPPRGAAATAAERCQEPTAGRRATATTSARWRTSQIIRTMSISPRAGRPASPLTARRATGFASHHELGDRPSRSPHPGCAAAGLAGFTAGATVCQDSVGTGVSC